MGIITQASLLVSIARPSEQTRIILSTTEGAGFHPPSVNITRRSLLLTKGNHWRFGTQAETPVLYNCPEMRSCEGAWGSELTTNIITVWAVEEVGVGGSLRNTNLQLLFVCLFYGAPCWEGRLSSPLVSLATVIGWTCLPWLWGLLASVRPFGMRWKERTQLSLLSCAHISHGHFFHSRARFQQRVKHVSSVADHLETWGQTFCPDPWAGLWRWLQLV